MVTSNSLYAWATHITLAIAATTASPEATPAVQDVMEKRVAQPRMTPGPSLHHAAAALHKRDSSAASFNTCGFINSNADSALYCGGDYSCVFFSSSGNTPGMAGCCATASSSSSQSSSDASSSPSYATCNWYSTCYDSTRLSTITRTDAMALRCTESASPRCASWTWPALGVVDFACTYSDDDYSDDSATATATGNGNWTTIAVAAVDTFFSEPTSWSVDVTWVPASALAVVRADVSSTDAAAVETGSSSGTGTGTAGSGVVASSSAGSSATATGGGGSGGGGGGVQTGVIVGGVIGGVVGFVGLVAAAMMFCCLMRRRKQNGEAGQEGRHEMQAVVDPSYLPPAEVSGQSYSGAGYYTHGTGTIAELDHGGWRSRPVEMDGMPKAVEMDTK